MRTARWRLRPASRRAIRSTPVTESTRTSSSGPPASRMPPTQSSPASSTTSFAMRIRSIPASAATSACQGWATVIAQAPASACRRKIAGAMVVLPWGANETPRSRQKSARTAMSWASADSRSTKTGRRTVGSKSVRPSRASAVAPVTVGAIVSRPGGGCVGARARRSPPAPAAVGSGAGGSSGSAVWETRPARMIRCSSSITRGSVSGCRYAANRRSTSSLARW